MNEMSDAARGAFGSPSGPVDERSEETRGLPGGRSERGTAALRGRRDSAGRRRFTAAERDELLDALEASGEGVPTFCRARGLIETTVRSWVSRRVELGVANPVKKRRARFTADERRAACEAFQRSGRTQAEFGRLWGVSPWTLSVWLQRLAAEGAKGLESRHKPGPGRPRVIDAEVREEIARTKRRFPDFGLRRVRDWLVRFRGIRVSAGTVKSALEERGIASPPRRRKTRRRAAAVRRFERARPMQLWQTDITSFVLTRHSLRVYLVVFLDDRSRYVVSWSLCTHQKSEMVQECLLDGIARFGKPEEVLSDQGPQYHSWRGKSAFDKLLDREGIQHVVARTHHPQTVGKCERLWQTVRDELWERAKPQDLAEARERLAHYFAHYNHFRPHQGIDGLVPADRFFNAEDQVRRALEARMSANELGAALSREPRQPVYLVGQIGEQAVSLVGEHGRVVLRTDDGEERELGTSMGTTTNFQTETTRDERDEHGHERGADDGARDRRDPAPPPHADGAQADVLRRAAAPAGVGACAVAVGERGGAEDGARAVRGDPRDVARQVEQGGGGGALGGASASDLAALADGVERDAGGAPAAAEDAQARPPAAAGLEPRGGSAALEEAHRRAGAQAQDDGGPGAGLARPAVGSEGDVDDGGARGAGGDEWTTSRDGRSIASAPWAAGIRSK
jgi:transposase InsO family protein